LEDRDPRLEVGRLDVGDEPPFEPRAQARLERRKLARLPIRRDDDLLAGLVQAVEGVEKLLLELVLAFDELNIVD